MNNGKDALPLSLFSAKDGFFNGIIPVNSVHENENRNSSSERKIATSTCRDNLEPVAVSASIHPPSVNVDAQLSENQSAEGSEPIDLPQSYSCSTCDAHMESLQDQRFHFKSDWHRYNVKRVVAKKTAVSIEAFESLMERLNNLKKNDESDLSSISGSESESENETVGTKKLTPISTSRIYFGLNEGGVKFSIFKVLVAENRKEELSESVVIERARLLTKRLSNSVWIILLCSGGHFAGLVLNPQNGSVLDHKTFHRYVVRAKAGGRQSTKDASGKSIKSAGSSLRRYNETALENDIQKLITDWSNHLKSASHIFVYAPSANQKSLFGSVSNQTPVFAKSDPRIRSVPISIRRPTLKEAKRVANILAQIEYVDDIAQEVVTRQVDVQATAVQAQNEQPTKKATAVTDVIEDGLSVADVPGEQESQLHLAARNGDQQLVLNLLEDGHDPTIVNNRGLRPYTVAADKETRNVFRRFMATNEAKWDWKLADVPSPLTEEMEAKQDAKRAENLARKKARDKERRAEKKAIEKAEKEKAAQAALEAAAEEARNAIRYGAGSQSQRGKKESSAAKPSEEMIEKARREERELRAMAAERRLKSLVNSGSNSVTGTNPSNSSLCDFCKADLKGKTPFYKLNFKYCSTACVNVHRLEIESSAE